MIPALIVVFALVILWMRAELAAAIRELSRRIDSLEDRHRSLVDTLAHRAAAAAERPTSAPPVSPPVSVPGVASAMPAPPPVPPRPQPAAPIAAASAVPAPERLGREPSYRDVEPDSLESEIGSRWLLYVGVGAIVIGAGYFQKLAIDYGWIGERARVIEGLVVGGALIVGGAAFIRRDYRLYGEILSGGGIAALYIAIYSASTVYALIPRSAAFAILIAITALAAWLADRHRSQGLAIMAVGGGFITPFLLPTGSDAEVVLFTYDAILVSGTMFLAHRRAWPALNVVSYVLTLFTIVAWAADYYRSSRYLVTEIYLTVFCVMFLYIARELRHSSRSGARQAAATLLTAPVLYYLASLAVLSSHSVALLIFISLLAAVGAALAPSGRPLQRVAIWAGVVWPLLIWSLWHAGRVWFVPGVVTIAAVYAMTFAAQWFVMRRDEEVHPADVVLLHLNPLVLYVAVHWFVNAVYPAAVASVAAGAALWHAGVAAQTRQTHRRYMLHFAGVAATLLAVAIALQFGAVARTIGWAVEAVVMVWLGLREQRDWFRGLGVVVFVVAVSQFLMLLPESSAIDDLVVLNRRALCGLLLVSAAYVIAWLHRAQHDGRDRDVQTAFVVAANVLTVIVMTSEISAYWQSREVVSPGISSLAAPLTLSLGWALYAAAATVTGLLRHYAPVRYFAIALFGLTVLKVVFVDIAQLNQIYRVSSIIGVGVLLLITSWLYHRFQRLQGQ